MTEVEEDEIKFDPKIFSNELLQMSSLLVRPDALEVSQPFYKIFPYNSQIPSELKKTANLKYLQEQFNKHGDLVEPLEYVTFGVVVDRVLEHQDIKCSQKVEVWKISDFESNPMELETQSLLFVHGDLLGSLFTPNQSIIGKLIMIRKLKFVRGILYDNYKNSAISKGKKKIDLSSRQRVCVAFELSSFEDLVVMGKAECFGHCSFKDCKKVVNMSRFGFYVMEIDEKTKQKVKKYLGYCNVHHEVIKRRAKRSRMDLISIGRKEKLKKFTYTYTHAVYLFRGSKIFVNLKSIGKLKKIKLKEDMKLKVDEMKILSNRPGNKTRGKLMVKFQKEKNFRAKIEKAIHVNTPKEQSVSSKEIKLRALNIAKRGYDVTPRIGRGFKGKSEIKLSFVADDSDEDDDFGFGEEEEEEGESYEPVKKKRKFE